MLTDNNPVNMAFLSSSAPMNLLQAMRQEDGTSVDIIAIVGSVADSDDTPYYPYRVREVALVDHRYCTYFFLHDIYTYSIDFFLEKTHVCNCIWSSFVYHCSKICSITAFLRLDVPHPRIEETSLLSLDIHNKIIHARNLSVDRQSSKPCYNLSVILFKFFDVTISIYIFCISTDCLVEQSNTTLCVIESGGNPLLSSLEGKICIISHYYTYFYVIVIT